jgi:hypothetical protein
MEDSMLKQVLICVAVVTSVTTGSLNAQEPPTALQAIKQASYEKVYVPGTNYEVVLGSVEFPLAGSPSTQTLLATLISWISDCFDLPTTDDLPKIALAPARKIAALRYKGLLPDRRSEIASINDQSMPPAQREVVAVYHDETRTIYLPDGWTGRTPAELSMLVHEIVHHLQNLAGIKYACPQERERLAYEVQERWLGLFGRDLVRDFEIDPFTLLVSTQCHY